MSEAWKIRLLVCAALAAPACGDDGGIAGGGAVADAAGGGAGGRSCEPRAGSERPDPMGCAPHSSDYAPCTDDGYGACVSDDGEYHRFQESISTIARVEAFERIADLLFNAERDATAGDFLSARMIYQEDEGLDSRVVRRYDPYFEVPQGTDCTQTGVPEEYPEYCVGPAKLQPILLDALNRGARGEPPREQAARVEGALLWFLLASISKESLTCTETARDCDSAYAYYTAGANARGGIGLARYVAEVDAYAHDRVWDGLLALRCWRDLDSGETATDLALRDRARDQLLAAAAGGVAAIVRDRLQEMADSAGDQQRYHFAFVTTLGPALVPEARARARSAGDTLASELAKTDPAEIDVEAVRTALDTTFTCP
jgi:hypothetical protein